jgi:hypothetical protein
MIERIQQCQRPGPEFPPLHWYLCGVERDPSIAEVFSEI